MYRAVVVLGLIILPVVALAQEGAVTTDDSHMALAPPERATARNPSDEHVAFMEALNAQNVSAETQRQNDIEEARRIANVDLHWGLP